MVAALCTLWRQLSVNPVPSRLFRPPFLPRIRLCTAVFIPLLLAPLLHFTTGIAVGLSIHQKRR